MKAPDVLTREHAAALLAALSRLRRRDLLALSTGQILDYYEGKAWLEAEARPARLSASPDFCPARGDDHGGKSAVRCLLEGADPGSDDFRLTTLQCPCGTLKINGVWFRPVEEGCRG